MTDSRRAPHGKAILVGWEHAWDDVLETAHVPPELKSRLAPYDIETAPLV